MWVALETEKGKATDSLLKPLEKTQHCKYFDFRLWPTDHKIINLHYLKPLAYGNFSQQHTTDLRLFIYGMERLLAFLLDKYVGV
jgi:hypothetical protein